MATTTKTIDIIMNLKDGNESKKLLDDFNKLSHVADELKKRMDEAFGAGRSSEAEVLKTKYHGILAEMEHMGAEAKKREVEKSLKAIETQANRTREKMEKLAQIGNKLALVGGAILAPFILVGKKYMDSTKGVYDNLSLTVDKAKEEYALLLAKGDATSEELLKSKEAISIAESELAAFQQKEPVAKRLSDLSKSWEDSQRRLGAIVTKEILPALEKGAEILGKIIDFAEKNPGVVKAALTIGTTLVILGGIISTTAQLVAMVATIQGLAAGAGLALGGGGAAAGAAGAGLAATIGAAFVAAAPILAAAAIAALAIWAGAELGLLIANAMLGTNYTIKDLGNILAKQWAEAMAGWGKLFEYIGQQINAGLISIGEWIYNALQPLRDWILGSGSKASGGYVSNGMYRMGEQGREFVMNNATTRSAERAMGGRITQGGLMARVTNNLQVGNGVTIAQTRRMVRNSQMEIVGALAGAF